MLKHVYFRIRKRRRTNLHLKEPFDVFIWNTQGFKASDCNRVCFSNVMEGKKEGGGGG